MERCCGWYNYLYSVSYLTLTAGDKGIKCPSVSPKQCKKGPSGTPPLATMAILSAPLATAHRWLHSLLPCAPGRVPERHVGGCAGACVRSGSLPRQAPCRGRCLVASGSLPLTGPCRDAWRVAASSLRCLGWPSRQAPLAGVLCLEWPSRQAPLAGALSPWLEYFVLEWLQRNHGGPWRSPGKPCRGVLRLPVHKFGILGYPYSSTPTGAPGPGPYTVPSAVGPGPKQGMGTRGLGHAVSFSVSTAPSPNGTRRLRRRGRDRGWFLYSEGRNVRPLPPL